MLSRSTVFEFKSVTAEEVVPAVKRGFEFLASESGIEANIEDGVYEHIASACGGDVRKSLNFVELSYLSANVKDGKKI